MRDFKVIQKVNIEELNRLASESGIKCENCFHYRINNPKLPPYSEEYGRCPFLNEGSISRNYYCPSFSQKDQKEPAPLKTLNIEPYKLDK